MASSSTTALDEGILKLVFLQEAATGRKAVVPLVEGVDWDGFLRRVRTRLGLPEGHAVQVRCLLHRLPWPLIARTALDERAHTRDAAEHSAAEQSALCSPYARAYPPPPSSAPQLHDPGHEAVDSIDKLLEIDESTTLRISFLAAAAAQMPAASSAAATPATRRAARTSVIPGDAGGGATTDACRVEMPSSPGDRLRRKCLCPAPPPTVRGCEHRRARALRGRGRRAQVQEAAHHRAQTRLA